MVFYLAIFCYCKYTTIKTGSIQILLKANTFLFLCLCVMFIFTQTAVPLGPWCGWLTTSRQKPLHACVCWEWDWALIGITWKILGTLICIPYGRKISRCFFIFAFSWEHEDYNHWRFCIHKGATPKLLSYRILYSNRIVLSSIGKCTSDIGVNLRRSSIVKGLKGQELNTKVCAGYWSL